MQIGKIIEVFFFSIRVLRLLWLGEKLVDSGGRRREVNAVRSQEMRRTRLLNVCVCVYEISSHITFIH